MSDNWIVQNLENALNTWNEKLSEIWTLITQSPETFKGGSIWNVVVNIHGALQAIGYALLVLGAAELDVRQADHRPVDDQGRDHQRHQQTKRRFRRHVVDEYAQRGHDG